LFAGPRFAGRPSNGDIQGSAAVTLTFVIQQEGFFQPDGIFFPSFLQ